MLPSTAIVLIAHAAVSPGHAWQLVEASGRAGLFVLIRGGRAARKDWLPPGPFLALGTLTMLMVPGTVA